MPLKAHRQALQRQQALVVEPPPLPAEPEPESEPELETQAWVVDGPELAPPEDRGPWPLVRILGHMVGRYPQGSIVSSLAFEYLDRPMPNGWPSLIDQGVVEYAYDADQEHIAGGLDAGSLQLLAALQSTNANVLPTAPWVNASPSNLLGAHYIPLLRSSATWTPAQAPSAPPAVPEVTARSVQFEVTEPPSLADPSQNATQQVRDF